MNNVFDIKRFGNYFLYDLRRAKNNYGLSLLILGLIPVILYIFFGFFRLISGSGMDIGEMPDELKYMGVFISCTVVIFGAGAKLYGFLTGKKAGSDFLMLPASTFEKWLAMSLIVCVVLPLVLGVLLFASDGVMGLLFPNTYGTRLFTADLGQEWIRQLSESGVSINIPAYLFLQWCLDILIFTLGAICFKKAKVAKTLLCLILFGMMISLLALIFFGHAHLDFDWLESTFGTPEKAVSAINWTISLVYAVGIGLLLGGTYYRLRTLKH